MPPPAPRCYELLIKRRRQAATFRACRAHVDHHAAAGRPPACHYCGECARGCALHSNFSSPSVLLPPAMKTGRLTLAPTRWRAK
jgi:ferredoxin